MAKPLWPYGHCLLYAIGLPYYNINKHMEIGHGFHIAIPRHLTDTPMPGTTLLNTPILRGIAGLVRSLKK